jgi:pimeloyl-ACP methyl ester carboxylesterase
MLTRALGLGAAALALTACTAAPAGPADPVSPIVWSECGPGLDCATVEVPQEYTDPDGPQIPLAVVRHRATDPAQRVGSLFFNPGGPGAPATAGVSSHDPATGAGPVSPDVAARFDVIGMDPRGVGGSGPVRCLTDEQRAQLDSADLDPTVPGGKPLPQLEADAAAFGAGCAAQNDPAYLASLSTDNVARDMDGVRASLGEEQISYLGGSYGTYLGAMYATLFPDRVRQMVLDAPMNTELWQEDPLELLNQTGQAQEQVLDAYFETCAAQSCPFDEGRFDALVATLEANPIDVPAIPGQTAGGRLDGATALAAAVTAGTDRTLWPTLTSALVRAEQGDGAVLQFLSTIVPVRPFGAPTGEGEPHTAVRCADWAVPRDVGAHTAAATELAGQAPHFGNLAGYSALTCANWPVENTDRYTAPLIGAGAPPVLVVGTDQDPLTPHPWARHLADTLEDGRLLTVHGVGHGAYRNGGPCVDAAVDGVLIDGRMPAEGATCVQDPPATTVA